MEIFLQLINLHQQSMDYLFCPSENCLNVPEFFYSYNPIKSEVQYKCNYNANFDNKININLQEFLDKSDLKCHECKKVITDLNFLFCKTCKNVRISLTLIVKNTIVIILNILILNLLKKIIY